jgi:hypothetical protein
MNRSWFILYILVLYMCAYGSMTQTQKQCLLVDTEVDPETFLQSLQYFNISYTLGPFNPDAYTGENALLPCLLMDSNTEIFYNITQMENLMKISTAMNITEWNLLIEVFHHAEQLKNTRMVERLCGNRITNLHTFTSSIINGSTTTGVTAFVCGIFNWGSAKTGGLSAQSQYTPYPIAVNTVLQGRLLLFNSFSAPAYNKHAAVLQMARKKIIESTRKYAHDITKKRKYAHVIKEPERASAILDIGSFILSADHKFFQSVWRDMSNVFKRGWNDDTRFHFFKKIQHIMKNAEKQQREKMESKKKKHWIDHERHTQRNSEQELDLSHMLLHTFLNTVRTVKNAAKYVAKGENVSDLATTMHRYHIHNHFNTRSKHHTGYHLAMAAKTGHRITMKKHHALFVFTPQPYLTTPDQIPITEILTPGYWEDPWWVGLAPGQRHYLRLYQLRDWANFLYYNLIEYPFNIKPDPQNCRPYLMYFQDPAYGCHVTMLAQMPPLFDLSSVVGKSHICHDFDTFRGYILGILQYFLSDYVAALLTDYPGLKSVPVLPKLMRHDNTTATESTVGGFVLPCLIFKGIWFMTGCLILFSALFLLIVLRMVYSSEISEIKLMLEDIQEVLMGMDEKHMTKQFSYDIAEYKLMQEDPNAGWLRRWKLKRQLRKQWRDQENNHVVF